MMPNKAFVGRKKLPRLGKVRLGSKELSERTGKEYPQKSEFFLCDDPRFIEVYGSESNELDVMLLSFNPDDVAPVYRKRYNLKQVLLCRGTGGEVGQEDQIGEALERNLDNQRMEIQKVCPCKYAENGQCGYKMNLMVMLPRCKGIGVFQIDTGGFNSIHSVLDFLAGLELLRENGINLLGKEFKLKLLPKVTTIPGTKRATTIYYLHFEMADYSLDDIKAEAKLKGTYGKITPPLPVNKEPLKLQSANIDISNLDNECEQDLQPIPSDPNVVKWVKNMRDKIVPSILNKSGELNDMDNSVLDQYERVTNYAAEHGLDSAEYIESKDLLTRIRAGEFEEKPEPTHVKPAPIPKPAPEPAPCIVERMPNEPEPELDRNELKAEVDKIFEIVPKKRTRAQRETIRKWETVNRKEANK